MTEFIITYYVSVTPNPHISICQGAFPHYEKDSNFVRTYLFGTVIHRSLKVIDS